MAADQYFCMIHEGRCGSTVLASLIGQHPGVVHFNEILTRGSWVSQDFAGTGLEKRRDALDIKLPDLCGFVREVAQTRKAQVKPQRVYAGFEIKFNQLTPMQLACDVPTLVDSLVSGLGGIRFMFLTRRNILRRHISTLRCLYKDVSHAKEMTHVNFDKVRVDQDTMRDWSYDFTKVQPSLKALLDCSESRRQEVRRFAETNGHLYLEYEDFERNPLAGAERIFDFLGLPRIEVTSPLLKTGDKPLAELIDNYDDVRDELAGSRWAEMLD